MGKTQFYQEEMQFLLLDFQKKNTYLLLALQKQF